MRITVTKEISPTERELWGFNLFDLTAVFVSYIKEVKPKGKRKWTIEECWDKYGRDRQMEEPKIPFGVSAEAGGMVRDLVKVKTWAEWKTM